MTGDRQLVDFLVIGAMKCGTTSLHHYLGCHPQLGLAPDKEVDFFFGPDSSGAGNFWRGTDWYREQIPAHAPFRGEVSPGYTSPDHPEVAGRIASVAPDVKLVYVVRDPLDRAVSQYRHHRRDGAERRPLADALLDADDHYVRRSRYADCIVPFLDCFPASRIAVVDHADLRHRTAETVTGLCRFLGADPSLQPDVFDRRLNRARRPPPEIPAGVAEEFRSMVADDATTFASFRAGMEEVTTTRWDHPRNHQRTASWM